MNYFISIWIGSPRCTSNCPRLLEHLVREIGGDALDAPANELRPYLLEDHGERIGLLAGRGGGAPDADAALGGERLAERRHHELAELVERNLVSIEERFVGRHRLDDLDDDRLIARRLEPGDEVGEVRGTVLARERQEPALDQVLLVGGEHEARPLLEKLAQEFVVHGGHGRSPENRRITLGAI